MTLTPKERGNVLLTGIRCFIANNPVWLFLTCLYGEITKRFPRPAILFFVALRIPPCMGNCLSF